MDQGEVLEVGAPDQFFAGKTSQGTTVFAENFTLACQFCMNSFQFDWSGVLTGVPATWLLSGLLNTLLITIVGSVVASVLAILLLLMRTSESRCLRYPAQAVIMAFRNTPLLVQLFFWYFAAYPALPEAFRDWVISDHWFSPLPDGFRFLSPEFICAWLGLSWFTAAFLAEELRAGLQAVSVGQGEAALSQGFSRWKSFRYILLPQAIHAWQPVVGQYLNLMKLSSLASGIGLLKLFIVPGRSKASTRMR
jgi:polar amino acid transport system permease protein